MTSRPELSLVAPTPDDEFRTVRLLGLPVPLHQAAQEHGDELQREFLLLAQQVREEGEAAVPHRLVELTKILTSHYGGASDASELEIEQAARSGRQEIDVEVRLPVTAAQACDVLGALLEEADAYCRSGEHLLTLAAPQELVRYRHWYLTQVAGQLRGGSPVRWSEYARREPA